MIIYIDISNYVEIRAHTGIQRVIIEFLSRLLVNNVEINYKIIYFDTESQNFILLKNTEVKEFLKDVKNYSFSNTKDLIAIDDIKDGDMFFDLDGIWNHGLKRTYLYRKLKNNNVKIINFIYDLVPIVKAQFSHENTTRNFTTYLYAIYTYSDLVFFDSRSAEKDFLSVKQEIGSTRFISTRVVKLGSDIHLSDKKNTIFKYFNITSTKYILFVGTLEPRKNQKLALDVFEILEKEHDDINLVLVGKEGWNNSELIQRIKKHPLLNKKLHWLNKVSDEELEKLYENAYICTYLSEYEGFGLPIAESLGYGKVTITSKNSSMYEVGKNFADYLIYNSKNELYDILDFYLKNEVLYNEKKQFIQNNYYAYSWDLTYQSVVDVFVNYSHQLSIETPNKLQFVFISIDIENLQRTIREIDTYMDFVSEYIIVTRPDMMNDFSKISSKHDIVVINENEILGEYSEGFSKRDHVSKNWLLRTSLLNIDILEKQFIMLDDDNVPLKDIAIEHFINEGKYNAYYFYDLLNWNSFDTEYDLGQHNMKTVLDVDGFELLSYSSHKPQIIDKKIFQEVVYKYFEIGLKKPIDEWSIYFNYAISKYPYLFNKIKFDTLNWPGNASDWELQYIPDHYNFENYYPEIYQNIFNEKNTYTEKLKIKEKQQNPYIENKIIHKNLISDYAKYDIVHGKLEFHKKDKSVFLFNMPYFIKAKKGTWFKLPINYKVLVDKKDIIEVGYYINGSKGAFKHLYLSDRYSENIFNFMISCTSLPIGEYELLIEVIINGENVFSDKSPYMVKLFVEN